MADKQYDAIFVGNSLTALATAALLAKRGKSVLLLDPIDSLGFGVPDSSFYFAKGPLLYFGYERGGAVEGYFSELAFPIPSLQQKGLLFNKVSPLLQIVQPSHRINLHIDEASYLDELKREYRNQVQKLKILFEQVEREASTYYPFLGQFQQLEIRGVGDRLGEWRKQLDFSQAVRTQQNSIAADFLSQYSLSADLREYFNLLSLFAFRKPLSHLSVFDFIRLHSSLKKGGVRIIGGYPTLVTFFRDLIKGLGGAILSERKISRLERQKKRLVRLNLSDGSSLIGSQFIVSQSSVQSTLNFFFTIRQDLIPLPMKERLIMTWGENRPPYVEDILIVCLNLIEGESDPHYDRRKIAVSTFLKDGKKISKSDHGHLTKGIIERLNWLIPFSDSEISPAPLNDSKESLSVVEDPLFSQADQGGKFKGSTKEILKGVSYYIRPKGETNVFIIPSDQWDTLGWGSSFVAGLRLANLIDRPSKRS